MKVGDLVRHKRHGQYYMVAVVDETAMVGIIAEAELKYIHESWIEVINESR